MIPLIKFLISKGNIWDTIISILSTLTKHTFKHHGSHEHSICVARYLTKERLSLLKQPGRIKWKYYSAVFVANFWSLLLI